MFCTKCGRELKKEDRFCAYCGTAARRSEDVRSDEIVFNSPFKMEAEKRTKGILNSMETESIEDIERPARKTEPVDFVWGFDEQSTGASKRMAEDVVFDWGSVIEKRNQYETEKFGMQSEEIISWEQEDRIKIKCPKKQEAIFDVQSQKAEEHWELPRLDLNQEDIWAKKPAIKDEPSSLEELEAQLFGTEKETNSNNKETEFKETPDFIEETRIYPKMDSEINEDKFYTFHQKTDAFQKLIDQEWERIQSVEKSFINGDPDMQNKWMDEILHLQVHKPDKSKTEEQEEENQNIESEAKKDDIQEPRIEVVQPQATTIVDMTLPALDFGQGDSLQEDEKERLRYSDVFPRLSVSGNCSDCTDFGGKVQPELGQDSQETVANETEAKPKKHIFSKIVVSILVLLLVAEGIVLAVKVLAPNSVFSEKVNQWTEMTVDYITSLLNENEEEQPLDAKVEADINSNDELGMFVIKEIADAKTIGAAEYNENLKYDLEKGSYAFEELSSTKDFTNSIWFTEQDGTPVTYAEVLVSTVIRYYDQWKTINTNEYLVGINLLEIGEIKTDDDDFYILCKLTFARKDGEKEIKYQTVRLKMSEKVMKVDVCKEETL